MSFISAKLIDLIPDYKQVESLFVPQSSQLSILSYCYTIVNTIKCEPEKLTSISRALFLVSSLKDKIYETLNIGRWSEVDENLCKAFTVATLLEAYFRLHEQPMVCSIKKVMYDVDLGLLLGCPLTGTQNTILTETVRIIEENFLNHNGEKRKRAMTESSGSVTVKRPRMERIYCSIVTLHRPSITYFQRNHFMTRSPALLLDCMNHWPALINWKDPDYLLARAGERTVPIEIGVNYTHENWSQDLVRFKDFFNRQILVETPCDRIEYLAQHNLFDQIPCLHKDILMPEYCCIFTSMEPVDIKAWLGPKGTISPMHHDPKHNLLCQVFGHKKIILAAPEDGPNLYRHESEMLKNTSQIDAENVDLEKFPLCSNVKFFDLNLYEGEMLYIPPGWWHYVRSLEKSFSVSFWWE